MRFLFFGAGAIGTYVGGSLALRGYRVMFLERRETAAEIIKEGLTLERGSKVDRIPAPRVLTDLREAVTKTDYDCAVFAMKAFDTAAILEQVQACGAKFPSILCLQNGVENEPLIESALGPGSVIPASVTTAVGKKGVGSIRVERLRGIGIGGGHVLSLSLVDAFSEAGLNAVLFKDGRAMKWSKLLTNLLANASSAILDMTPAEIFANPGLHRLEITQIRETLAVMKAMKIEPLDLPETNVKALAFAAENMPAWLSQPAALRMIGKGRGGKMPSLHIDLLSGRGQTEVDFLNGAVVRIGESLGIPTPANKLLNDTLLGLTRGEIPLDSYTRKPAQLLDAWAKVSLTR